MSAVGWIPLGIQVARASLCAKRVERLNEVDDLGFILGERLTAGTIDIIRRQVQCWLGLRQISGDEAQCGETNGDSRLARILSLLQVREARQIRAIREFLDSCTSIRSLVASIWISVGQRDGTRCRELVAITAVLSNLSSEVGRLAQRFVVEHSYPGMAAIDEKLSSSERRVMLTDLVAGVHSCVERCSSRAGELAPELKALESKLLRIQLDLGTSRISKRGILSDLGSSLSRLRLINAQQ